MLRHVLLATMLAIALMLITLHALSREFLVADFAGTGFTLLTTLVGIGFILIILMANFFVFIIYIIEHFIGQRQGYYQDHRDQWSGHYQGYHQGQPYDESRVNIQNLQQCQIHDCYQYHSQYQIQGQPEGQIQRYGQNQAQIRNRSRDQSRSEWQCNPGQGQNNIFCEGHPVIRSPGRCRSLSLDQGQSSRQEPNQANSVCITFCTCDESGHVRCEQHDPILLISLSKHISNYDLMYELGIALCVSVNTIDICKQDNVGSINQAVRTMLHNWYQAQDGLGLQSQGLKDLKRALVEINRPTWVTTVIENHFQRR